jgi:hypothetical protein
MSSIIALPVVKNKFWIVEEDGAKIATIQAREDGAFVYVHKQEREVFPSIKKLAETYNIKVSRNLPVLKTQSGNWEVYGFPVESRPHNVLYDVKRKIPIYTKTEKSRSYYCAGHFLIKTSSKWESFYCPKLITVERYPTQGPFHIALDGLNDERT